MNWRISLLIFLVNICTTLY